MGPGTERDVGFGNGLPNIPAIGVRHRHGPRNVDPIDFNMESPAAAIGGHTDIKIVTSGRGHVTGVFEPLPGFRPAHNEACASIRSGRNIYAGGAIRSSRVDSIYIVIRNTLPAVVKVFSLDSRGDRKRRSRERSGTRWRR